MPLIKLTSSRCLSHRRVYLLWSRRSRSSSRLSDSVERKVLFALSCVRGAKNWDVSSGKHEHDVSSSVGEATSRRTKIEEHVPRSFGADWYNSFAARDVERRLRARYDFQADEVPLRTAVNLLRRMFATFKQLPYCNIAIRYFSSATTILRLL